MFNVHFDTVGTARQAYLLWINGYKIHVRFQADISSEEGGSNLYSTTPIPGIWETTSLEQFLEIVDGLRKDVLNYWSPVYKGIKVESTKFLCQEGALQDLQNDATV